MGGLVESVGWVLEAGDQDALGEMSRDRAVNICDWDVIATLYRQLYESVI